MKRFGLVLVFLITICISLCYRPLPASAMEPAEPAVFRVLCISSYSLAETTVPDMLSGIKEGLSGIPCEVDYEFMDSQSFYKPEDVTAFYHYLAYKLKNSEPYDLLITCDDNALRFWKINRQEIFQKVPMIFVGVNSMSDATTAAAMPTVTGIAEIPDYVGTFDLMHELFPDRTTIVAIVDASVTGRSEYVQFLEKSKDYDTLKFKLIFTDDYSTKGLAEAIGRISSDSMILYLDFMEDASGNTYSETEASELLYDNAKGIPIFRATSANIGHGVLGGKIYSYYAAGKSAGEMAADVLSGAKDISDIPLVEDTVTEYIFDQNILDEFGIPGMALPADSTIVNPHRNLITFYKENPVLSNLILVIIGFLFAIMWILVITNRQREQLVNTDFLTQIPNRHYIQAKVNQVTLRKIPFAILMMDVDHFKTINDTLGHAIGDELLVGVASRLKELSSRNVLFARIGGDEFMALITGRALNTTDDLCKKLVTRVTEVYNVSSGPLHITTSVGLAAYPEHCPNPESLNAYADSALYYVKEHGRNGYQIYSNQCSIIESE